MFSFLDIKEPVLLRDALGPANVPEAVLTHIVDRLLDGGIKQQAIDGKFIPWIDSETAALAEVEHLVRTPDGTPLALGLLAARRLSKQLERAKRGKYQDTRRSRIGPFWELQRRTPTPREWSLDELTDLEVYDREGNLEYALKIAEALDQEAPSAWIEAIASGQVLVFEVLGSQVSFVRPETAVRIFQDHPSRRSHRRFEFLILGQLPPALLHDAAPPVTKRGRKSRKGQGSYEAADRPFAEEGLRLLKRGEATSKTQAVRIVIERNPGSVEGRGSPESTITRLVGRISKLEREANSER